jgi:hypothetical protein
MAVLDLVRDLGWHAPLVEAGARYVKANVSQPMTKYCDQNIVGQIAHYQAEGSRPSGPVRRRNRCSA